MGQFKMVGGDQTPTAWRKEEGGCRSRRSWRMMTRVVSVMPMFFWAPPNMMPYLVMGMRREMKFEDMSATMRRSGESRMGGKEGNSTPSTVSLSQ